MRARCQHFGIIILGQTVCLAVGLFMQRQLFSTALRRDAEEQAWSALWAAADEVQDLVTAADPVLAAGAVERLGWKGIDLLLADQAWQTLLPGAPGVAREPRHFAPLPVKKAPAGPSGSQESTPDRPDQPRPARGMLTQAGESRPALVWVLPDGQHRAVALQSSEAIDRKVATALAAMLPVNVVTFLWTIALLGMTVFLLTTRHEEVLADERARAATHALRRTQDIMRARDGMIFALAKLAGSRDNETGAHLERISAYSRLIANALRNHPRYAREVTPTFVRLIERSSVLHDIGKVGVDDAVLRKPGPLTEAERENMQTHTVIAGQCLGEIAQRLGGSNFLEMARTIALAHHERWDGTGYPVGLRGEQIPLAARIVAVAEVYDALVTCRVYKPAIPHEDAIAAIKAAAGTQFDPELVRVMLDVEAGLREIMLRHTKPGDNSIDRRHVPEQGGHPPCPDLALLDDRSTIRAGGSLRTAYNGVAGSSTTAVGLIPR